MRSRSRRRTDSCSYSIASRGKPLWPIEERPVPKSDVPGEIAAPTQPFPTVVPPFTRQGMTVKDMYDAFMTDEEKVWWKDRLTQSANGPVYAARAGRHDPDAQRQRRRVVLRFRRGPDERHRVRARQGYAVDPQAGARRRIDCVEYGRPDSRPAARRTRRTDVRGDYRRTARARRVRAELPGLSRTRTEGRPRTADG